VHDVEVAAERVRRLVRRLRRVAAATAGRGPQRRLVADEGLVPARGAASAAGQSAGYPTGRAVSGASRTLSRYFPFREDSRRARFVLASTRTTPETTTRQRTIRSGW
jgi:hypothetical protein